MRHHRYYLVTTILFPCVQGERYNMAAKRLLDESDYDTDDRLESSKRLQTRPSFSAVLGEAVMMKSLQGFCSALEPMLRRVVNEEVEKGLKRGAERVFRPPPLQIQAQEQAQYELSFAKQLSLPVFTGSRIEDQSNGPLRVIIYDAQGNQRVPTSLPYPIKIEIVVLDGEFPHGDGDGESWTSEYFDSKIVCERTGKRPLITGDVLVTMRDGCVSIGDITFTDNSSWIRSRKFRLGARVERGSTSHGVRIREAITVPFVVKDHRGELYKKHHPPSLNDEVWRLEKIGKDGVFHRKLATERVKTVQDFLKLWVVDPARLRTVLGVGMSDKMFELTIKHAKDCVLGNKQYILRGQRYTIFLNPICQVVGAMLNGMNYPTTDLIGVQRAHVENMVREAYEHWNSLEEVDGFVNDTALLPLCDSSYGTTSRSSLT